MLFKKLLKRLQPVVDTLGIIQAVERKNNFLSIEPLFKRYSNSCYCIICNGVPEFLVVDTNRKKISLYKTSIEINIIVLRLRLQHHLYRMNKVLHIIVGVKT